MTSRENHSETAADPSAGSGHDLRQKAEAGARERAARTSEDSAALSPEEIQKSLHELRVHQIELEMQNEELRTAQAEIQAGRDRYIDLYDLAPGGYCTLSEQGLILEANLTAATLLGTTRGELIEQPISRFILKDDQDIYYLHRRKLFETGERQECELRLIKSGGVFIWAHLTATAARAQDGAPMCRVVIIDITERKQVEDELRAMVERYRFANKAANDVIWDWDVIQNTQQWNEAGTAVFGWTEIVARPVSAEWWVERVHPDDRERVHESFFAVVDSPELDVWHDEYRFRKSDGAYAEVMDRGYVLRDEHGKAIRMIGAMQDITERKRAEENRERLQSQLTQAQKMESVGRLAGGVAHDFNNMLGIILGYAELALERVGSDEPLHADLKEILKAAQRSADLTRQLLAFARKQTIAPKMLDLNATVEGMLNMLRRLIGEDINLTWRPGRDLWSVKMDPTQIDQMLANLCVNARDAIAGIGKISVEAHNITLDEEHCAQQADFTPGDYVTLTVTDDGCGMDFKTRLLIFDPFFTTKEADRGTGLGLSTVYGIVRQNNGFIDVYSEPGKGTTYIIYLPRHAAEKTEPLPTKVPVQAAMRGHETILLVEDEPAILNMTTIMLERHGYTVLPAITPGEAIRLAREHIGRIDLLLTDVIMPEMNGRDLAKNIVSIHPDIKRLFMSGYTANVITKHGVLNEGEHFIQKPFSVIDLVVKLRGALEG
jgi:PAS domain S-box-containing protein